MTSRWKEIKKGAKRLIIPREIPASDSLAAAGAGSKAILIPGEPRSTPRVFSIVCLAVVYFIAAKFALKLAFVHPSASSVWPGTGIALSANLLLGYKVWPGIFFGAFLANVTTAGSALTSIGIAAGNTLEGFIGAYLLNRFANGPAAFKRAPDILKFTFLAATSSTLLSATIGVMSLVLGRFIPLEDFGLAWFTWWLGDGIGSLLLTPLLVLWRIDRRVQWNHCEVFERAVCLSLLAIVNLLLFGGLTPWSQENYPLEFLCVPFFIWTAFRFGQRETATAVVVLGAIAIWGTLHGYGPFAMQGKENSLLLLQSFMGVTAVMSLVLSASVAEYRRVESELLYLAVTDPLTGLANYRKFVDTLDLEIKRAERNERSLAIIFLDVDNLKLINDRLGHVVGNQALCRVASALRASCRSIDVVARYGGDEFAVILPEVDDEEAARRIAMRISDRLAQDHDGPRVTVSAGVAVYPTDGNRKESLVSAADSVLYQAKSERHPESI